MHHHRQIQLLALTAVVIVAATLSLSTAVAATTPRLAGPWYTPRELKALVAYSKASSAQRAAILAGQPTWAWPMHDLRPEERIALDAYANASFAEKQRILAGRPLEASARGAAFDWGAASAGAAAMLATVLVLATVASRVLTLRGRRQSA